MVIDSLQDGPLKPCSHPIGEYDPGRLGCHRRCLDHLSQLRKHARAGRCSGNLQCIGKPEDSQCAAAGGIRSWSSTERIACILGYPGCTRRARPAKRIPGTGGTGGCSQVLRDGKSRFRHPRQLCRHLRHLLPSLSRTCQPDSAGSRGCAEHRRPGHIHAQRSGGRYSVLVVNGWLDSTGHVQSRCRRRRLGMHTAGMQLSSHMERAGTGDRARASVPFHRHSRIHHGDPTQWSGQPRGQGAWAADCGYHGHCQHHRIGIFITILQLRGTIQLVRGRRPTKRWNKWLLAGGRRWCGVPVRRCQVLRFVAWHTHQTACPGGGSCGDP